MGSYNRLGERSAGLVLICIFGLDSLPIAKADEMDWWIDWLDLKNIVFLPGGVNPSCKCDRQVGLELGCSLVHRWGLSSARLGSFVGKYSFPPNGSKSQGQM